jgi:hypothetical protein
LPRAGGRVALQCPDVEHVAVNDLFITADDIVSPSISLMCY